MKHIKSLLTVLVFLLGIPAYFIGVIAIAVLCIRHLPLPVEALYPLGAIVVALGLWFAVVSSRRIFQRLGL